MRKFTGLATAALYIATIFMANAALKRYGIVTVAPGLVAPVAVYFVGAALILRDGVQVLLGRLASVACILIGASLSYYVAPSFAVASGVAFLLSESVDFAVFTPLQARGWNRALAVSTALAAVVDSYVFLRLAFHSEAFFQGQVVGKLSMTVLALAVSALVVRPRLVKLGDQKVAV